MPKEGQTANRLPPYPPPAAAGRKKPNVVLIYWLVCVCVRVCVCVCVFNAIVFTICQHNSNCLPYQLGVSKTNNLATKFFED